MGFINNYPLCKSEKSFHRNQFDVTFWRLPICPWKVALGVQTQYCIRILPATDTYLLGTFPHPPKSVSKLTTSVCLVHIAHLNINIKFACKGTCFVQGEAEKPKSRFTGSWYTCASHGMQVLPIHIRYPVTINNSTTYCLCKDTQ